MIPLALLGGVAARGLAGRAGAGAVQRMAAGAAGNYGVRAVQRQHQNRQQATQQRAQDHGITQWARENPGEAMATAVYGGVKMLSSGSSLGDGAAAQTSSILQSTQFH